MTNSMSEKEIDSRRRTIVEKLDELGYVSVLELSNSLGVSAVTIRTDLTHLEKEGVLLRTHGGAKRVEKSGAIRLLSNTMVEFEAEKKAIARAASRFITDGSTIIVDSGSTTVHLLNYVSGREIMIVTNSIPVIEGLKDDQSVEILLIGGNLRRSYMGTIGPLANAFMQSVHVNTYFMGSANYDMDGVTCTNLLEAELKKSMLHSCDRVVFMADSSKFGKKAFASLCSWDQIDVFVTDKIDPSFQAFLSEKGVEVITATLPQSGSGLDRLA